MKIEKILIFGTGGHAKSVFDVVCSEGKYEVEYFIDLFPKSESFIGIKTAGQALLATLGIKKGIVAIGDNNLRERVALEIKDMVPDFVFISAVHASSSIGSNVLIGSGTVVMANVAVNIDTQIGSHCIINTGAIVEHDCNIGDFASLATGSKLGGHAGIGRNSAIGIGAMVNHLVLVGDETIVGTGSVVIKDLENNIVAFGSLAKKIRSRQKNESYL